MPYLLDRLEVGGTMFPPRPRPRYRGLIRGLLFVVPILGAAIWVLFVGLP